MFDTLPFDFGAFDRWAREVGDIIIDFPLSVKYICTGSRYSDRIVCQKGDTIDRASLTIYDCSGNPLPLSNFDVSVKIMEYSSHETLVTIPAEVTSVPGTINFPLLVNELDKGYYMMNIMFTHNGEVVIAPSYGFLKLSVV